MVYEPSTENQVQNKAYGNCFQRLSKITLRLHGAVKYVKQAMMKLMGTSQSGNPENHAPISRKMIPQNRLNNFHGRTYSVGG